MRYTPDLTDAQGQLLPYSFPKASRAGRPRRHTYRELLNAMFYAVRPRRPGAQPVEGLGAGPTVYPYLQLWKRTGLWEQIHTHLRQHLRPVEGRRRRVTARVTAQGRT